MSVRALMKQFDLASTANPVADVATLSPSFFVTLQSSTAVELVKSREMRIVGYARRSSKKDGSDSIDRQRRAHEEYAQRRFGRPLDDFYSDVSVSGRTWKRPGLQRLMQDAENGRFTHIIVEDIDRVARTLHIAAAFKEKCDGWNVAIHSTFKGAELDGSDVAIRGFLSADQVTNMRHRSMEGRRKKAASGGATGAMPFGYIRASSVRGDWKVDESKRKLIEDLFDACIDGVDCNTLARILNAREILEKSGDGKWTSGSMRELLCNPKYMGVNVYGVHTQRLDVTTNKYVVNDNPAENWVVADVPHWAIVSKNKWHAACSILRRSTKQTLKRPHALLSSEHAVCANCGFKMTSLRNVRNDVWELRCKNSGCPERKGHSVKMVEDEVLKAARKILSDPQYEAAFEVKIDAEHERICQEIADRRKAIEHRIETLDAEIEVLLDKALKLETAQKLATAGESDEFHGFESERITRRVNKGKAELRIARQEYAMLPRAPQKLDSANRKRLLDAFDLVAEMRASGKARPDIETEALVLAEAAIGNLIEKVVVGTIYPGRAARLEIVVRLDAIYGEIVRMFGEGRRSVVSIIHPALPTWTKQGFTVNAARDAWASRLFGATDEQFAAVEPAIDQHMRRRLARYSMSTRDFVDLIFLTTRTSIRPDFLRYEMSPINSMGVAKVFGTLWLEPDQTWKRMSEILRDRYPDIYQEMNPAGFLTYREVRAEKQAKPRTSSR